MLKSLFKVLIPLFSFLYLQAQTSNTTTQDFSKTIATRFSRLWYNAPQEKVYLHTDKPYYSAGEEIWFKAYLVNASTHIQNTKSNFVYVELIDKSDTLISRVKIKRDSFGFSGNIKLQPEIPAGKYTLRAYTSWMQNAGTDFFFSKHIYIGNKIDDRITCNPVFGTYSNGKVQVTLNFTNAFGNPVKGKEVKILQSWIKSDKKRSQTTIDNQGKISFQAMIDTTDVSKKYIEINIKESGLKFRDKIYLPDFRNDFDVQFFPESGVFLNDELQIVGFKAIGTNGLSVEIEGAIYNQNNEEITEIRSLHKGMGKLIIKTNPDESYYAKVTSSKGLTKRFELPKTQKEGIALQISNGKGKIFYSTINKTSIDNKQLFLLVHTRGVVYYLRTLMESDGVIAATTLPAGISTISVMDSLGNIYCERLVFNKPELLPLVKMTADKTWYSKRSPVKLDFNVLSSNGKPFAGDFSLSITDMVNVENDTVSDNILSNLLLTSDLKGYIEDPAAYFVDNSSATNAKIDLLMLTQGWRRFKTEDYTKGRYPEFKHYMEVGQTVSGKVLNLLNKPVKGTDIIFLSAYKNRIVLEKTDSAGRFLIQGIEYPDSTTMIVKAKSKTKLVDVEVKTDKDEFPPINTFIPQDEIKSNVPPAKYFQMIKEKYYSEGGMLMVNLEEFTVNAEAKKSNDLTEFYAGMADTNIGQERLEDFPGMGVLDLLSMQAGIQVNGQEVSIRNAGRNPLFIIDGIETENIEDVLYLNSNDIENIAIFKGGASTAMWGSKGGSGVIAITLKRGYTPKAITPPSLVHISPLGFQKPVEFYMPKYEVDSVRQQIKPDLRTTIYWNPKIKSDVNGNFQVNFYTADQPNNYRVILEGISNTGEICRFMGIIQRRD